MTTMQRQQRQDILLMNGGDPMRPRRSMSERSVFVPPLELTISVPTQTATNTTGSSHRHKAPWQPPQELQVDDHHEKWTPPRMIKVKESFAPPSVVVIVDNKPKAASSATTSATTATTTATADRIPDVIQVQESRKAPMKKARAASFRKEPPLGRIVRNLPSSPTQPVERSLADEISRIQRRESDIAATGSQRRLSRDPPAAKASTTTNKIQRLTDFSAIAKERRSSEGMPSTTTRLNYLLDTMNDSSNSSNETEPHNKNITHIASPRRNKRQSWSGPSESSHNNTNGGGRRIRRSSTLSQQRHHLLHHQPHWIGVTGSPEDWIHAKSQHKIVEVGRKIAFQRQLIEI